MHFTTSISAFIILILVRGGVKSFRTSISTVYKTCPYRRSISDKVRHSSSIGASTESLDATSYPVLAKDVIKRLTSSLQEALVDQKSRISIELPAATDFGVETTKGQSNFVFLPNSADKLLASNRQVAQLVTEMFRVLASTTVVVFPTDIEVEKAKEIWGGSYQGEVISLEILRQRALEETQARMEKGKKSSKLTRIQKDLLSMESINQPLAISNSTEVLLLVGFKAKEFHTLLQLNTQFGAGTVIININSRYGNDAAFLNRANNTVSSIGAQVDAIYPNVFCYTPNPSDNRYIPVSSKSGGSIGEGLLLYHEYKKSWMLAENSKKTDREESSSSESAENIFTSWTKTFQKFTGQQSSPWKTLWSGSTRPNIGEMKDAIQTSNRN